MKRFLVGALLSLLILVSLLYAADYLWLRYRISRARNPYGSVTVESYYAIQQKSGKTEFDFNPPELENCVHSLFPHFGYQPCWYASRRSEQRIDIKGPTQILR